MRTMNLIPTLFVALGAASLGSAAAANTTSPVSYTEKGTGNLPGTAEVAAPAGFDQLLITGLFTDATGGFATNLVDLFQINITNAGHYFFDTFGSEVADTQLFLFAESVTPEPATAWLVPMASTIAVRRPLGAAALLPRCMGRLS
jgi:hypothetical protein